MSAVTTINYTIGPVIIGVFVNTYLFGVVSYQFAIYFTTRFNDPLWIKATVILLCITDVFYSAAVLYTIWVYSITAFVRPGVIKDPQWPFVFTPTITAISALLTQNLLGYRIYRLTENKVFYGGILVSALVLFICGVILGVWIWLMFSRRKWSFLSGCAYWVRIIFSFRVVLQAIIDITLSATLTWLFYHSQTGGKRMDTILTQLIRGAIQTGFFASIFALAELILGLSSRDTKLYAIFAIPLGRVYTNTLMDTLNMRPKLRKILSQPVDLKTISTGPAVWAPGTHSDETAATESQSSNNAVGDTGDVGLSALW